MSGTLTLEEQLAVPYILDVRAVDDGAGDWRCRLAYVELPGCVVEADGPLEALDELELLRERIIRERHERGLPLPAPRLPLRV